MRARSAAARRGAALGACLLAAAAVAGCPAPRAPRGHAEPPTDGTSIVDPVSGVSCPKTPASESAIVDGRTYYFCSPESAAEFRNHPEKHADPPPPAA